MRQLQKHAIHAAFLQLGPPRKLYYISTLSTLPPGVFLSFKCSAATSLFSGLLDQMLTKRWQGCIPLVLILFLSDVSDATDSNSRQLVGVFCVAKLNAESNALREGLNWACGPGTANCSAIQPNQPCYEENNLIALASYAYNDYYHKMKASGGTCSFGNTASITNTDPSHDSCIFAGSTMTTTNTSCGTGTNPSSGSTTNINMTTASPTSDNLNSTSPLNVSLQVFKITYLLSVMLHLSFNM